MIRSCFSWFIFVFVGLNFLAAQSLEGFVGDSLSRKPLLGAEVVLLQLSDSSIQGVYTDEAGRFSFQDLQPATYTLSVQYIGYAPYTQTLKIDRNALKVSLYLREDAVVSDSVQIVTTALEVLQKGDTTEYNANAQKIAEDATAEELVKKMTGVVVDREGVKVKGETVKKVLVDGKPFFDNDPRSALSNLPGKSVQRVQLYEESNPLNPSEENVYTMNIITKPEMRIGTFGRTQAGYGYADKYLAAGNLNSFNGTTRMSVIAKGNNVNEQGFGFDEVVNFLGDTDGNRRGGDNGGGNQNSIGADLLNRGSGGITAAHSIGLNYNDSWGKKVTVAGTYFGNYNLNTQSSNTTRQYLAGIQQLYAEEKNSNTASYSHKFTGKLDYNIDSLNSLQIRPSFSLGSSKSQTATLTATSATSRKLNESDNLSNNLTNNLSAGVTLDFAHRFRKPKRVATVGVNANYTRQQTGGNFDSYNFYYNDSTLTDSINQLSKGTYDNYKLAATLTYTEPLSKVSSLRFQYVPTWNYRLSNRGTYKYDLDKQYYADLDSNLSNHFNSSYVTQLGSLSYLYQKEKLNITFKTGLQYATLSGNQFFPFQAQINRPFLNVLPEFNLRKTFKNKANIFVRYNTSTSPPEISQLQNVIDNRNPLIISTGNSDLKQSYQHSLALRYRFSNNQTNSAFAAMLRGDYTHNAISYQTIFVERDSLLNDSYLIPQGVQLKTPVNVDGNAGLSASANQSYTLEKWKARTELGVNGSFRHIPSFVNGQLNRLYSTNMGANLRLISNLSERIEYSLGFSPNYNFVKNSLNTNQNAAYFNLGANFGGNWVFYKQFFVGGTLGYQYFRGLSANYNPNFLLWNMTAGTKLGKKQQWKISVYAFDLLNQNRNVNRTNAELYIEDKQTNVLSRYFMLNVAYNFNKFKSN